MIVPSLSAGVPLSFSPFLHFSHYFSPSLLLSNTSWPRRCPSVFSFSCLFPTSFRFILLFGNECWQYIPFPQYGMDPHVSTATKWKESWMEATMDDRFLNLRYIHSGIRHRVAKKWQFRTVRINADPNVLGGPCWRFGNECKVCNHFLAHF